MTRRYARSCRRSRISQGWANDFLNSKDQADMFNVATNFGIRHHRKDQKSDDDTSIWLRWMVYDYLAIIHPCVRLIEKSKSGPLSRQRMPLAPAGTTQCGLQSGLA